MPITIHHRVPRADIALGLVLVEGVQVSPAPVALAEALDSWIRRRESTPLTEVEEARRKSSRDILRNGSYKPTGRGKPASEYLLRATREGSFPRINGPVDANNLLSLEHCLPISLLDMDRIAEAEFEIRLGQQEEQYVFNSTGQVLGLKDLVCGCALSDGESIPLITPIKDSMTAKIQPHTTRALGCIYSSLETASPRELEIIAEEFLRWLSACGAGASGVAAVLRPGELVSI